NNWIWTTYRRAETTAPVPSGSPVVDMMHNARPLVTGYTDKPALLNLELNIIAWEADGSELPEGNARFSYLYVDVGGPHGSGYPLDETLDSFAAKVGAPPRPKIEVPAAFMED